MKKTISMLLVLALAVSLLAGCGKEDFFVNLWPEDADLSMAPNVVLENPDSACNLGGWRYDDYVSWYPELPAKDTYTLRFYYSMPGDYEPCTGLVSYYDEDGEQYDQLVDFFPTSADSSWDTYDWVETEMKLPKGYGALTVTSWEIPEGQDYFLNLRMIQIYTGEAPDVPDFMGGGSAVETISSGLPTDGSGWWVRPDDYDSPGMSLVDCFHADMEMGTWTAYNSYGEPGSSYECSVLDGIFTMDMDVLGAAEFLFDGTRLLDPEEGTVEFVLVEDPGFKGQELDFDGTWYFVGDPENGRQYVLESNTFRKMEGELVTDEGTYTKNDVLQGNGTGEYENILKLGIGDFRDLTPNADHTILFEQDGFDTELYVREDALDPAMIESWDMVNELMNMDLFARFEDDTMMLLSLEPYGFYVANYVRDGEGYTPSGDPGPSGHWELAGPGMLRLMYNDGTEDLVEIPEPEGELWVESLQGSFRLEPIF